VALPTAIPSFLKISICAHTAHQLKGSELEEKGERTGLGLGLRFMLPSVERLRTKGKVEKMFTDLFEYSEKM